MIKAQVEENNDNDKKRGGLEGSRRPEGDRGGRCSYRDDASCIRPAILVTTARATSSLPPTSYRLPYLPYHSCGGGPAISTSPAHTHTHPTSLHSYSPPPPLSASALHRPLPLPLTLPLRLPPSPSITRFTLLHSTTVPDLLPSHTLTPVRLPTIVSLRFRFFTSSTLLPQPPITPHTLSCSLSSSIVLIACLLPSLRACLRACLSTATAIAIGHGSHHQSSSQHPVTSFESPQLQSTTLRRQTSRPPLHNNICCLHTHTRRRHPPAVTSAPSLHPSRDSPSSSLYARAKPPLMLAALCTD